MSKKTKKQIEISFVDSPSAENVTGSSVYIKTPKHNILLDAGFVQTNNLKNDYAVNSRQFKKIKIKNLDYIFLTHTHGDHVFLAPALYKNGCKAQTIIPKGSLSLLNIMLENCASILMRDSIYLSKKNRKYMPPIFETKDILELNTHIVEKAPYQKVIIDDELSFRFIPSGHLLYGCQLELFITIGNTTKKILYTGDLGNPLLKQEFTEVFEPVNKANYIIAEATYGDKSNLKMTKVERNLELMKLKRIIHDQVSMKRGKILIPSFAQSRTQVIAYLLYEMLKDTTFSDFVYIDSPLAIRIFEAMEKLLVGDDKEKMQNLLNWSNLRLVENFEESQEIMNSEEACVIISSSGMCEHGRVKEYLKYFLPQKNVTVVFIGYSAEGTIAEKLKNGKRIEIDRSYYPTKCQVVQFNTFSSHMPFDQLIKYYSSINCEKIFLHHGSQMAKENLRNTLLKELEKQCKTTDVIATDKNTIFII